MGLCANMKYILCGRNMSFIFGSRNVELIWTIFFLQPGYGHLLLQKNSQRNHCRLLRGLPLFWVMEEGSTQMFLLRVVDGVLVRFLSILWPSELGIVTEGIPSPYFESSWRVPLYCGSTQVLVLWITEGHWGSTQVSLLRRRGWSTEVALPGHGSERIATVPYKRPFSVTITIISIKHC